MRMRYALCLIPLLILAATQRPAQAQHKAMSAIDIIEALVDADPALRDRGALELSLMSEQTGVALGAEITRVEVNEAQAALLRIGIADTVPAATAACCALDSDEHAVRSAALDALVAMTPAHVSAVGEKHLTADRLKVLRALIEKSDYIKLYCESAQEGFDGQIVPPIRKALTLTVLLDRFFGVEGMPMLMRRIADFMLGDEPALDEGKSAHRRMLDERLRRGAAMWCEAIWIEDPAIKFNFSAISPYSERSKAVSRIKHVLTEFETQEVTYGTEATGITKFTGRRYGDVLMELLSDSVSGIQAAAWLRLHWWSGEKVVICGEGYAEAVDKIASLRAGESRRVKSRLQAWWIAHRTATD